MGYLASFPEARSCIYKMGGKLRTLYCDHDNYVGAMQQVRGWTSVQGLEKLSVLASLVRCSQAVHTQTEVLVTRMGVDVETLDRPDLGSRSTVKTWPLILQLILLYAIPSCAIALPPAFISKHARLVCALEDL